MPKESYFVLSEVLKGLGVKKEEKEEISRHLKLLTAWRLYSKGKITASDIMKITDVNIRTFLKFSQMYNHLFYKYEMNKKGIDPNYVEDSEVKNLEKKIKSCKKQCKK